MCFFLISLFIYSLHFLILYLLIFLHYKLLRCFFLKDIRIFWKCNNICLKVSFLLNAYLKFNISCLEVGSVPDFEISSIFYN